MIQQTKNLIKKTPLVGPCIYKWYHRWQYRDTRKLIENRSQIKSNHPSVLHFSFNRSATQYVKSVLRRCAVEAGLTHIRVNEYAFNSDFPFLDHLTKEEMDQYNYIFKPRGYLYSVFGGMVSNIPDLDKYKVVFMTRDPRDILVSTYYSISYSHPAPGELSSKRKTFKKRQNAAWNNTIDEFVLQQSEHVHQNFLRYHNLLLNPYSHVHVTTYERMVEDFKGWLTDLLAYCEFNISDELFQSLLEKQKQEQPDQENKYKHNRKGEAGDYKDKLKPETINKLNRKFSTVLDFFGYSY